jgi:Tfp pilus assembly protein PilF
MQGRYGEALAGLHGTQAPATLNNVGVAAMSRGDLKSAETYLVQALDASPSQYDMASKNLQRLKILQGQDAGSEQQKKQ